MKNQTSGTGIGFGTLLFLLFLALKLTHVIDWSWWWITAPLWAGFAIFFAVLAVIGMLGGVIALINR